MRKLAFALLFLTAKSTRISILNHKRSSSYDFNITKHHGHFFDSVVFLSFSDTPSSISSIPFNMEDSDDDIPLAAVAKPKKIKLKLKKPKLEDTDDEGENGGKTNGDVEMKPAKVKSESSAAVAPAKKKRKRELEPDVPKSSSTAKKKKASAGGGKKELKKLEKSERLQFAMQSFLWWNAPEPPEGSQWVTMEHAGVSFPEPYQPHGVKMLYEGKPIDLSPVEEEA